MWLGTWETAIQQKKISKKVSKTIKIPSKIGPKIDAKSMKNRGAVPEASQERLGCPKGQARKVERGAFWSQFWDIFGPKSKKGHPKRHPKVDAEKVSNLDAKRLPK